MSSHDIVLLIIGVLGPAGVIGAIVAFFKLKPETSQIIVNTAQGAVIVQSGVIETLQTELIRVSAELAEVRQQREKDITELRNQLAAAILESEGLRRRIRDLENGLASSHG